MTNHPNRSRRQKPAAKSPTERVQAHLGRAAVVLPPLSLDQAHADALARILARRGGTRSALLRALILAEDAREGS